MFLFKGLDSQIKLNFKNIIYICPHLINSSLAQLVRASDC